MIESQLNRIKDQLLGSSKQKMLCISTTANINNAALIVASMRETPDTIAGNIILRNAEFLKEIIQLFDGMVDYFLVDSEVKNEFQNLEKQALQFIKKSKYLIYKPNDFTVASLDMFIAVKTGSLEGKKVLIIGCGNLGAKSALSLCERGAEVYLYDIDIQKADKITNGLNLIKRSNKLIESVENPENLELTDIIIGCTPGIPAINAHLSSITKDYIVDAGNGCLSAEAITEAKKLNVPVYVLSSLPGYWGMISNWIKTQEMQASMKSKKITEFNSLITPGILGAKGDIIVNDVDNIQKIIGICDGKGDILYQNDAGLEMKRVLSEIDDPDLKNKLKNLYF